jgi:Tfp pilus assembly major pilin PilA
MKKAGGKGASDGGGDGAKSSGTKRPRNADAASSSSGVNKRAAGGKPEAPKEKKDNRSLWEKSGGISSQAVTAATIQRNKGAIAQSSGKKISFD